MSWSQFSEDEMLLGILAEMDPPHFFVEFGAGNGAENCTRVLAEAGWDGVWMDADPCNMPGLRAVAKECKGRVDTSWRQLTRQNMAEALADHGVPKDFGVLSIDVDGNDYWLWYTIPRMYRPAIVIIEAQIQKPHDEPYIMPYDPYYLWPHDDNECGASIASLRDLGSQLGYRFAGKCPDYHSPNLFFVLESYEKR